MRAASVKAAVIRLSKLGFLKQVRVKRDQPHWSSDEEGRRIGLEITNAGSAAIGVGDDCKGEEQPAPEPKRRAKKAADSDNPVFEDIFAEQNVRHDWQRPIDPFLGEASGSGDLVGGLLVLTRVDQERGRRAAIASAPADFLVEFLVERLGTAAWTTVRTSRLSISTPNAEVATMPSSVDSRRRR